MNKLEFSIIIAVYQRADELRELLQSLTFQTDKNFEVVIVDDGSPSSLEKIANEFRSTLNVIYFYKENSGASLSRNFGTQRATGNYFIFLDSDTIIPENYIQIVRKELESNYVDAFGGSDDADDNFSNLQKAINFSMTSFLTTGGIRGGKKVVQKFQPRSFNMGISKNAFEKVGGFGNLRYGEDPDLSMKLWENEFETRLFSDAKVYHKRRTSLKEFAKQVYHFGIARPILNQRHPTYTTLTFWFPSLFTLGLILSLLIGIFSIVCRGFICEILWLPLALYLIYFLLIFVFASYRNKSFGVGILSIITTLVQFISYGYGFLLSYWRLQILKQNPQKAFPSHFII